MAYPIARFHVNGKIHWGTLKRPNVLVTDHGEEYALEEVTFLPPCEPTKIVCIGFNYSDHAEELQVEIPKEPLLFLKPPSALLGHLGEILYPRGVTQLDYEGELAVVIGRRARYVPAEEAFRYVLGYTVFNDVTARNYQRSDSQWIRAKCFDTFAPLGPWILSADALDPSNLRIRTYLNGELRQDSCTRNLIFDVPTLIAYISRIMTLEPGDVIATGTPPGVGPMSVGDRVDIEIEGIGVLTNTVREEG